MSKSNFERDLYLNSRFRDAGAMAALGTVYVALATADLTAANVTANELVIGTGGYARTAVPTTNTDWAAPADSAGRRAIVNLNTITGATATANLNAGNPIGFYGMYDAPTGGNLIRYGALGTAITILSGQVITIPAGAISIAEG
jgi:hypothetical protein